MENKSNKEVVEIYGEVYSLKGTIEPSQIKAIAALVDEKMNAIASHDVRLSQTKIAVLAALNIAEEYLRLEKDYKQLLELVKEEK